MIVEIVRLHDKQVNRHGVACRIGFTADYIDAAGVFHAGQVVYTENRAVRSVCSRPSGRTMNQSPFGGFFFLFFFSKTPPIVR
jgi:hypothetical protein